MHDLKGRVAIITGGAKGIGRATCFSMARDGAHVVCGDMLQVEGKQVEAEWNKMSDKGCGGDISFFHCDVSTKQGCESLVRFAVEKFGRLDVLFSNAGIQMRESNVPLHEVQDDVWDNTFDTNIRSCFFLCRAAIPEMLRQGNGGSIIVNSSVQGIQAQKHYAPYGATKAGLVALAREMAVEYGPQGIRVNSLSPGTIETDMMRDNTKDLDYVTSNTPLRRIGRPEDIACAALFLAKQQDGFLTGQNIVVDGGITIKGGWAKLD